MPTEKIKQLNMVFEEKTIESPTMDWIILDSNPILRNKSVQVHEITDDEMVLINRMVKYIDTCYDEQYQQYKIRPGIAIAAPQVGLFKKIIYIHFNENGIEHKYLLVNPEIIARSQAHSYIPGGEGCLSVPKDVISNIARNYKIIVKAYDLIQQKDIEINATNLLSICLQHEIDHLDGILYTDRVNKEQPNYYDKNWIAIK